MVEYKDERVNRRIARRSVCQGREEKPGTEERSHEEREASSVLRSQLGR